MKDITITFTEKELKSLVNGNAMAELLVNKLDEKEITCYIDSYKDKIREEMEARARIILNDIESNFFDKYSIEDNIKKAIGNMSRREILHIMSNQ